MANPPVPVEMPAATPPVQPPHPHPYPPPGGYPPQQPYGQPPYPYPYPYPYPAPYPQQAPPSPGAPSAAPTDGTSTPSDQVAAPPVPYGYPPQPYGYPPPQGYPGYPPQQPAPGAPAVAPPSPAAPGAPPVAVPPAGHPPAGYPAPPQGYPPQGYPPQGYPPQGYPYPYPYPPSATAAAEEIVPPAPPPLIIGAVSPTYKADIAAIFKATKGFGCDDRALINILAARNGATIEAIRNHYVAESGSGKDLIKTLQKETSGTLRLALKALAYGPIQSEAFWAQEATEGMGTNERLLTESLLGKQPYVLTEIKKSYAAMFERSLESDVKEDTSGSTQKLFLLALEQADKPYVPEQRKEDVSKEEVERDCKLIRTATTNRIGTDDIQVQMIFTKSSPAHLREMISRYFTLYKVALRDVIKSEFSGHQRSSFLWILDGVIDRAARDAKSLEESMAGIGTKDILLVSRLIRIHWSEGHMEAVKRKYFEVYQRDLGARIRGETSGNLEKLCVKLLEGDGRGL